MPPRTSKPSRRSPESAPKKYHNVPVLESTWQRLGDYKRLSLSPTFDAALNELMDSVPLEMLSERALAEHKERMKSSDWTDWRTVRKELGDDVRHPDGRKGKAGVR